MVVHAAFRLIWSPKACFLAPYQLKDCGYNHSLFNLIEERYPSLCVHLWYVIRNIKRKGATNCQSSPLYISYPDVPNDRALVTFHRMYSDLKTLFENLRHFDSRATKISHSRFSLIIESFYGLKFIYLGLKLFLIT